MVLFVFTNNTHIYIYMYIVNPKKIEHTFTIILVGMYFSTFFWGYDIIYGFKPSTPSKNEPSAIIGLAIIVDILYPHDIPTTYLLLYPHYPH